MHNAVGALIITRVVFLRWQIYPRDQSQILVGVRKYLASLDE